MFEIESKRVSKYLHRNFDQSFKIKLNNSKALQRYE